MDTGLWPSSWRVGRAIEIPLPLTMPKRQRRGVIPALATGHGAEAAQLEAVRSLLPRVWGNVT